MVSIFGPNTLWSLVAQSDFLSKLILLGLLLISICSWTLALYKFFSMRATKKELDLGLQKIYTVSTLEELLTVTTFLKNKESSPKKNEGMIAEFLEYFKQLEKEYS